ncbi:MAG TPA: NUDIX hydrolase [Anaerolineales bacterium]|jgi:ADP-ribose pyrophosphatase|nr:NUDIX hydrolase [Anaerolineales bacterium]
MGFKTIDSKHIFSGRAIHLWKEQVVYPDGRKVSIEVLKHPGSIGILPLDDQGHIWFVRQYRHPTGGMLLELPAGTLETGEDPKSTAAREIREEIGMAAETITPIGKLYLAPGYSTELMHLFLATGLTPDALELDPGEYLEVEKYPVEEVYRMLDRGEIIDGKSVAILGLMRTRLLGKDRA